MKRGNRKKNWKLIVLNIVMTGMILAVMPAFPAAAGEAAEGITDETGTDTNIVVFPGELYFGRTWPEISAAEKQIHAEITDMDKNSSAENKTLEDGTVYTEAVIKNVPQQETAVDQYYYLVNDQMAACVYKYQIPENADKDQVMESLKIYGTPVPLIISSLDSQLLEMVSDQAGIQDGMSSWKRNGFTAIAVIDEEHRSLNFVLISQQKAAKDGSSDKIKMSGLTGTEDLTPEEIKTVNTYIDYVQSQAVRQVNEFIAFLKSRRSGQ